MGEPAAVATAHAFLDGHLDITLPPETHAQLTADHVSSPGFCRGSFS